MNAADILCVKCGSRDHDKWSCTGPTPTPAPAAAIANLRKATQAEEIKEHNALIKDTREDFEGCQNFFEFDEDVDSLSSSDSEQEKPHRRRAIKGRGLTKAGRLIQGVIRYKHYPFTCRAVMNTLIARSSAAHVLQNYDKLKDAFFNMKKYTPKGTLSGFEPLSDVPAADLKENRKARAHLLALASKQDFEYAVDAAQTLPESVVKAAQKKSGRKITVQRVAVPQRMVVGPSDLTKAKVAADALGDKELELLIEHCVRHLQKRKAAANKK